MRSYWSKQACHFHCTESRTTLVPVESGQDVNAIGAFTACDEPTHQHIFQQRAKVSGKRSDHEIEANADGLLETNGSRQEIPSITVVFEPEIMSVCKVERKGTNFFSKVPTRSLRAGC